MRRIYLVLLAILFVVGSAGYFWRKNISLAIYQRITDKYFASKSIEELPDGLHAGLCGTGSPLADFNRSAPCTLVVAGKRLFIFDAGSNASNNIILMGFNLGVIESVFLTHFHSDHIGGLGDLMLNYWLGASSKSPLPIRGPTGVKGVVEGFMQAYYLDSFYRISHHGETLFPRSGAGGTPITFPTPKMGKSIPIINETDLTIEAFTVNHSPIEPAVGYRVRYKDRTLVISGDTRKSLEVQRQAKDVDLLIHEALSFKMLQYRGSLALKNGRNNLAKIMNDIQNYHTSPEQAAEIAQSAGVRFLLLTHIVPQLPVPGMKQIFLGNSEDIYDGEIRIGEDGDFISMPAGNKEIIVSNRLNTTLLVLGFN